MVTGLRDKNHFWAVAGIGFIAAVAVSLGVIQFARQSDLAAKQREEGVVINGIGARIHEIEALIVPNLLWDEALRHLDNHFDPQWAHENIAGFFTTAGGFEFATVLDANDRPIYAMQDGADLPAHALDDFTGRLGAIVQDARRAEAAQQALHPTPAYQLHNPIQYSTPIWRDGHLYVATATVVGPDFGHARLMHARAPLVITARDLDEDFPAVFASRYMLNGIHLHDGDSRPEVGEAHAPIFDPSGAEIATLDWQPQTPGTRLLHAVGPWMLGLVASLLAVTLFLYAMARRHAVGLAQSEQRSLHMAYHDALTGLSNRAHFDVKLSEYIEVAARKSSSFAALCLDLDRFKELNDCYGHGVGDELLKQVAERLADTVGPLGLCARIGGDEFAVLVPRAGQAEAQALAEAIIGAIALPYDLSIGVKTLSCSVGAAVWTPGAQGSLEMLRRADMALYAAKNDGRNCARIYDAAMDSNLKAMQRLKDDLRTDLAADKLTLVYQPQVRWSGEVVGFEALVRWTHHELGPISPAIFVPLAEEAGLIKALGEFTLFQAAKDSLRWPGKTVAVNCSATQIQDPSFAARAKEIVESAGACCTGIEIEMTEGVLFNDEARTFATLTALHDFGFAIALDDFGTGFSSLSYLRRFPIDKIKIDRSFVVAIGQAPKADALLSAIIKLAQALNMKVIAEGVETREQWLRVSFAGCPKIQGFVASKPLKVEDVQTFLSHEPVNDLPESLPGEVITLKIAR